MTKLGKVLFTVAVCAAGMGQAATVQSGTSASIPVISPSDALVTRVASAGATYVAPTTDRPISNYESPGTVAPVPLPASLPLLLAGLGGLALLRRRAR